MATNGSRFVDPDYAKLCEESGLHTLYLQFDGMNDDVYLKMRGQRLLDKKIAAVRSIEQTNMRLVLVPTIISSVNVDQLGPIFQFALEHNKFRHRHQHSTGSGCRPHRAGQGRRRAVQPGRHGPAVWRTNRADPFPRRLVSAQLYLPA